MIEKGKLLEEKIRNITDLSTSPVIVTLEVGSESVAPTTLFASYNKGEIPPLIKVLPHKFLQKTVEEAIFYMASKRKGTSNDAEKMYSSSLWGAIVLATTKNYGMSFLPRVGSRNSNLVIDYLENKKIELDGRMIPYTAFDMTLDFWLRNQASICTKQDFFAASRKKKNY
jgi:hypothetical protein